MRFIVERDALADGVIWVSRSLSARPIMPVLLGVLIKADKKGVHLSGYDLETSGKAEVVADVKEEGTVLVSGKLLSDIARALPNKPVTFSLDGNRVSVISGSAKFALPTLSVSDYPNLPELPSETGRLSGDLFAEAVGQVAIAAGKDDSLPVLTGVYVEIEENKLILAATDRYRLAVRELNWDAPRASAAALIRARTLNEAAKSLAGAKSVSIALAAATANERLIGFASEGKVMTSRMLDGTFPPYRHLLPSERSATAVVEVAPFVDSVRRVALVADKTVPLRLAFNPGALTLEAGVGDDAQATEELEIAFDGEALSIAFNPTFLLDGLAAVNSAYVEIAFTGGSKPAVLSGKSSADGESDFSYRYLLMPMRYSS
ncbi:MAG: DNA polymerase III subunit beta [Candidatus Nanopelagicaceae bacterium]|nr:DNA polymerase III subunit beta [Candidatus Nanopelagicaceae bacterium]